MAPPRIQTYHCLCSTLLLSSTHTLSSLARRTSPPSDPSTPSISDNALILPLASSPPPPTTSDDKDLPAEGYTILLGLAAEKKTTIIRRSDGFEKRILYRCSRCRVVVGYELQTPSSALLTAAGGGGGVDVDTGASQGKGKGKGKEMDAVFGGRILYILPGGLMSSEVLGIRRKIKEDDVGFSVGAVGAGGAASMGGGRATVGVFE